MNAVETIIMQAILKSVTDYNNSIEILNPGVKKYFKDHFDEDFCSLSSWKFIEGGNRIEISCSRLGTITTFVELTDTVPTETIVSIAVELSFNKRLWNFGTMAKAYFGIWWKSGKTAKRAGKPD